ncbi:MAG: NAD-dependent epimerase/dehydratase family protein [Opitutaceae bacterium]|nr:NAD-dependent epimerase/dehydratase family protein [Opitutaceae bacterium]
MSLATHHSSLRNSPALVTGGTGFLGRRLVEHLLADGRLVTVLARSPAPDLERRGVRFVRGSVDDHEAVAQACTGVKTVFHVAAKVGVWGAYADYFRINVLGTRALLDACRKHGVRRFVHTSTPSVVYNGRDLAGADESLPLTTHCPSAYPLTKAIAEREVLAANGDELRTIALRPHLIWGVGDPHLVPRLLARARTGRLRIVGDGRNRVDLVHVANAVDAHLLAEQALAICHLIDDKLTLVAGTSSAAIDAASGQGCHLIDDKRGGRRRADGRAFFITNGEPVMLWEWINDLLCSLGEPPITKRISLRAATAVGAVCELAWRVVPIGGEPPMTRFVAAELAKDHWFDITAARRDLGYAPRIAMAAGMQELLAALRLGRVGSGF